LYVKTREALFVPVTRGTKLTFSVQDAFTATVDPHVDETRKDAGCGPVTTMPRMESGAFPVFVTTIDFGSEMVFTARL